MTTEEIGIALTIEAQLERFEQNMASAGQVVETTVDGMDRATKRSSDQFKRLEAALDPTARALQRLERDTAKVKRALDAGVVSSDRAAKVQDRLNTQYEQTIARLNGLAPAYGKASVAGQRFSNTMGTGARGSRQMGQAVQQAGFQVGDFAVQIASGQGVLRPFIQQGTQLVSMFGPMGAVIGAAGAIVGAFATTLFDAGDALDSYAEQLDKVRRSQESINDVLADAADLPRKQLQALVGQQAADLTLAESRVAELRAEIEPLEAQLQAIQDAKPRAFDDGLGSIFASRGLSGAIDDRVIGDLDEITEDLQDNRDSLERWLVAVDQGRLSLETLQEALAGVRETGGSVTKTLREEIDANTDLADALRVSQREYDVTRESLKILSRDGFDGTEEAARALAEKLVDGRDEIKAITDATKAAEKAAKDHARAIEREEQAYSKYIGSLKDGNELLRAEVEGREEQVPLLEAEAKLRQQLGRALIPEEVEELRGLIETREELTGVLKAQEEAEKELERAAEKAARETQRVWENAGDAISDAFADTLFEGEDLFDALTNAAKRSAAEIASAFIIRPLISPVLQGVQGSVGGGGISVPGIGGGQVGGGGFSLGGLSDIGSLLSGGGLGSLGFNAGAGNFGVNIAQFIGGGAETQALFGNAFARGGSIGGIAGGFAGNFLADSLLGNRGAGASIGGSIGAIAGSFIPIPVLGTAIGAFAGNAIGGLFGNSSVSEGPTLEAVFDNNGRRTGLGVDNDGDMGAARQLANSFGTAIEALLDVSGGTLSGGAYISNSELSGLRLSDNNGQWLAFDDETALLSYLVDNRLTGGDPTITRALQNSQASDVNGLLADAATAQGISDFISAANDNTGQVQQAIDAIWENARDMIAKASELGFSIQDLTAINDTALSNAQSVLQQRDLSARSTVLSGVLGASGSINAFLDAQQLSATSSLNPLARFEAAQNQFGDLLADVRGGDLSKVGELTGAASTLLDIGSSRFASTESFVGLERFVTSSLNSVNQGITSEDFIQDQTNTLIASLDVQTSQLDALNSVVTKLDELLAQQRADAAARAA